MFAARELRRARDGLTLSKEQFDFARAARDAGRPLAIWSISGFRIIGIPRVHSTASYPSRCPRRSREKQWRRFFEVCAASARSPAGSAALQIITIIADERFDAYRRSPDFNQLYIFPGGMLPSPSACSMSAARSAGLRHRDDRRGPSRSPMPTSLKEWRNRFDAAWPKIAPLGFDERFKRMWDYYLCLLRRRLSRRRD
mgnify:CR=1 FL=1